MRLMVAIAVAGLSQDPPCAAGAAVCKEARCTLGS